MLVSAQETVEKVAFSLLLGFGWFDRSGKVACILGNLGERLMKCNTHTPVSKNVVTEPDKGMDG